MSSPSRIADAGVQHWGASLYPECGRWNFAAAANDNLLALFHGCCGFVPSLSYPSPPKRLQHKGARSCRHERSLKIPR